MKKVISRKWIVVAIGTSALLIVAGVGLGNGGHPSPPKFGTGGGKMFQCNQMHPDLWCDAGMSLCVEEYPDNCHQICTPMDPATGQFMYLCQSDTASGW